MVIALGIVMIITIQFLESKEENIKDKYTLTVVENSDNLNFPDSGVYYEYQFEKEYAQSNLSLPNADSIFEKLIVNNINIEEAWYKKDASSCHPPGSEVSLPVVVSPALIIKVSTESSDLEKMGFQKTENPSLGACVYSIRYYTFH